MSLGECQAALAAANEELAQLRDQQLRTTAEIANARKRAERDATAQSTQRLRDFSVRLIEVADNLERALSHAPEGDPLRPGVQATLQQLQDLLRQQGVAPIPVRIGDMFDPQIHEAIAGHPADVTREAVAEVTQTGYMIDGQVLRPARVVVAMPLQEV